MRIHAGRSTNLGLGLRSCCSRHYASPLRVPIRVPLRNACALRLRVRLSRCVAQRISLRISLPWPEALAIALLSLLALAFGWRGGLRHAPAEVYFTPWRRCVGRRLRLLRLARSEALVEPHSGLHTG